MDFREKIINLTLDILILKWISPTKSSELELERRMKLKLQVWGFSE